MNSTTTPANRPSGAPWPIREASRYLGISERHLLRLVAAAKVKSIMLGRRRMIPAAELMRVAGEGV